MNITTYITDLQYRFANNINGSAAGVILGTVQTAGTYLFCWDTESPDPDAPSPLRQYTPLASVIACANEALCIHIHGFCVIPEHITCVSVFFEATDCPVAKIDIPVEKQFRRGQKSFSFGSLSDCHHGCYYPEISSAMLTNALHRLASHGVCMVADSGDLTSEGFAHEFREYGEIVDAFCEEYPHINVYTTNGNHDVCGMIGWIDHWVKVGRGSKNYRGELKLKIYGKERYDYTVSVGNDIFIFLTQRRGEYGVMKTPHLIHPDQLKWLKRRLRENKDKRVFLYFHSFLDNMIGDASNGYYEYDIPIPSGSVDEKTLCSILRENKNVILFSGHSHWSLLMQDLFDTDEGRFNTCANISDAYGDLGILVHNPSVTEIRTLDATCEDRYHLTGEASEGYLVDVYDDCVVLHGYDLLNDKLFAPYSYLIDTSGKHTVSDESLRHTVWSCASKKCSTMLSFDERQATLFIAEKGVSKVMIGPYHYDPASGSLRIGRNRFRLSPSANHTAFSLFIEEKQYCFEKDAKASICPAK
ncbi:MAG: metallophosphoesterase [Clostridia bacterium]|nr:metallophosphoesterase [Clostridia bacterium]